MLYLGGLTGSGMLISQGEDLGRTAYDFDVFKTKLGIASSGEIRLAAAVLKEVFGRKDVQLRTDDGRLLELKFSEKQLSASGEAAHVDVTGDLPTGTITAVT